MGRLRGRRIGVIGSGIAEGEIWEVAYRMGYLLGKEGALVYTGGLGGVMEAALKGASEAGTITVGILPGNKAEDANPYVKIPVVTNMGHARNVILVSSVEAVVAISGEFGTLSEIAIALKLWKPVIGIKTWENLPRVRYVETPEEALKLLLEIF